MPDPQAVSRRLLEAQNLKTARETTGSPEMGQVVALGQIADSLFAIRNDIQDLRIAIEALVRKG